jgi:hypothetical protein
MSLAVTLLAVWLVVYESSKNRALNGLLSPVLLTGFGVCVAWAVFEPSVRSGVLRLLAIGKVDVELLAPNPEKQLEQIARFAWLRRRWHALMEQFTRVRR